MTEHTFSIDIEQLIKDLQEAKLDFLRQDAATKIGQLTQSSNQIVAALITARNTDSSIEVRKAANEAILYPVHQAVLEQNPDLKQTVLEMALPQSAQSPQEEKTNGGQVGTILGGLGLVALGIILTNASHANSNSGSYTVYYGLIFVGVITFFKGLFK
jgi:hypothetical protein